MASLQSIGRKIAAQMIKTYPEATVTAVFTLVNAASYDPATGEGVLTTVTKSVNAFMGTESQEKHKTSDGQEVDTFTIQFPYDSLPREPAVQDELTINGVRHTICKVKADPVKVMASVLVYRA